MHFAFLEANFDSSRFWPICPFGARNGQICFEFLLLCGRPRKGRVVSGPSALLGPETVKFASNFCYCAVDQEKVVFQWKRAVSGPSAFLGPEMVKFASNFCYCAVNQEKAVFRWKRAVSGPSALLGPEMINLLRILLLCCRPRKSSFSMEMGRCWPICPFGARNGQICFEFLLLCCSPRKSRFSMETGKQIEYGVHRTLAIIYPKPCSIYSSIQSTDVWKVLNPMALSLTKGDSLGGVVGEPMHR